MFGGFFANIQSSVGFSPLALNPLLWAAPRLSITESGGNVSALPDLSGNGNDLTQLVGSSQPTYTSSNVDFNGVATVDFNGTSDFLRNSALSESFMNSTVFLVYKVNSYTISGDQVFGTEATNSKRLFYGVGGYLAGAIANNGVGFQSLSGAPFVGGIHIGSAGILMLQFEDDNLRACVNNGSVITKSGWGSTVASNQISIGYSIGLNARWLNMDFAECIVVNSVVSETDTYKTMEYLNNIYAIW